MLYTPTEEHFGIVPCEAMMEGVPVIAVNSAGPTETVEQGITGFLLPDDIHEWSEKMRWMVEADDSV